jgi:hypothetical protein
MTKCVKVLQSQSKSRSMDQSQARIEPFRPTSEPVIGPCFLLLLLLVTLTHFVITSTRIDEATTRVCKIIHPP